MYKLVGSMRLAVGGKSLTVGDRSPSIAGRWPSYGWPMVVRLDRSAFVRPVDKRGFSNKYE